MDSVLKSLLLLLLLSLLLLLLLLLLFLMIFKDHDLSFQVHEERQVKQWVNERQFYNYMQ